MAKGAPALFTPLSVAGMSVPNRIAVAPMCQYSGDDGSPTDWHLQLWMNLAMSGAGMIVVESTAVERHGRITHGCLGLYSDNNEVATHRALASARAVAAPGTVIGVQLAHAGRKASVHPPWAGGHALSGDEDPWSTISASAIPHDPTWHTPAEIDEVGIARVISRFADAARRAVRVGYDFVEVHCAHGYLIHSFLSPLTNKRTDSWNGPIENRMRFALEVFRAVREAVPSSIPVGARISATDWAEDGFTPDDSVVLARALKDAGTAFVCVSSSGVLPQDFVPHRSPACTCPSPSAFATKPASSPVSPD